MEGTHTYITTTLPYVNADPHVGFALELVYADMYARFKRREGMKVFFNTGTDEHGQKIWQTAQKEGVSPQEFVDLYAKRFEDLLKALAITHDAFIRTTDEKHKKAAEMFWKKAEEAGDIYKKKYKGLYCVGHEAFITEKELVDGKCLEHNSEPVEIEEENYFFRFSKYEAPLKALFDTNDAFVIPDKRLNELRSLLSEGLEDFSISRVKERMPWGVPVPGDEDQVMYVWFDALVNYISTLGWPEEGGAFETYWQGGETVQFAGKDNLRQQAAIWQAMLLSLGIKNTDHIVLHGHITSDGKKMSKSIGNVVNPFEVIEEYSADALRYFLLRHIHPFEDSDFTEDLFKESYNAHLANGIGNLTSRIVKMASDYEVEVAFPQEDAVWKDGEWDAYKAHINAFEYHKALDLLWAEINHLDSFIAENEPFKVVKTNKDKAQEMVAYLLLRLHDIAVMLEPALPETSKKVKQAVKERRVEKALFERKE